MSANLQPGQSFSCPHCGHESILQSKARFDGWTPSGQDLICGLCKAVIIEDYQDNSEEENCCCSALSSPSTAAQLLGLSEENQSSPDLSILGNVEDARFCRDCLHYIRHPFECRCALWDRVVEPMDDCPRFERGKRLENE